MNFLPKLLQAIGFLPTVVSAVEHLFQSHSGAEKKDAVMSVLETAINLSGAIVARDVVDEAKFKQGLSAIISGTVDCLNASVWAPKAQ